MSLSGKPVCAVAVCRYQCAVCSVSRNHLQSKGDRWQPWPLAAPPLPNPPPPLCSSLPSPPPSALTGHTQEVLWISSDCQVPGCCLSPQLLGKQCMLLGFLFYSTSPNGMSEKWFVERHNRRTVGALLQKKRKKKRKNPNRHWKMSPAVESPSLSSNRK